MLDAVVRITPMLSGVDRCGILLADGEPGVFRAQAAFGIDAHADEFATLRLKPGESWLLDEIHLTNKPLLRPAEAEPDRLMTIFGPGDVLGLPLLAHGELIGTLWIGASPDQLLSRRKAALIGGIANQAAMAIESAQSAIAQREGAGQHRAAASGRGGRFANRPGRDSGNYRAPDAAAHRRGALPGAVVRSRSAWTTLPVKRLACHTPPRPNLPRCGCRWNCGRWATTIIGGQGTDRARSIDRCPPTRSAGGVVTARAQSNRRALIVDRGADDLLINQRRLNILSGIANQTAIAIENVRLITELATRQLLEKELDVAREIQKSFLPECCPVVPGFQLSAYWKSARRVGGDFYDFMPLANGNLGIS